MTKELMIVLAVVALSAPARADDLTSSQLKNAHDACEAHRNILTGAAPLMGYAAGFEKCIDIQDAWDRSEASRQQKDAADKDAIDAVHQLLNK